VTPHRFVTVCRLRRLVLLSLLLLAPWTSSLAQQRALPVASLRSGI